jgi:hypothetical protein
VLTALAIYSLVRTQVIFTAGTARAPRGLAAFLEAGLAEFVADAGKPPALRRMVYFTVAAKLARLESALIHFSRLLILARASWSSSRLIELGPPVPLR